MGGSVGAAHPINTIANNTPVKRCSNFRQIIDCSFVLHAAA
jgi:hypothetical protein